MMRYSVQPRDLVFVKGYGFFSFAKNMGKNIGKNIGKIISKRLNSKYSQKVLDHARKSATSSKGVIQKTAETTVDLIDNEIAHNYKNFKRFTTK